MHILELRRSDISHFGGPVSQLPAIPPGCMHATTYASKLRAPRKTDEPQTQYNELKNINIH